MNTKRHVNFCELFMVSEPFATRPCRLVPTEKYEFGSVISYFTGQQKPPMAIRFKVNSGGQPADFLWTSYPPFLCISKRVFNILNDNKLTGWSTYEVEIVDKKNNLVPEYYGLAITSFAGNLDLSRGQIMKKQSKLPVAQTMEVIRGIFFNESKWDGSDIFRIGGLFTIITKNVYDKFVKSGVTNTKMTSLAEWEVLTLVFKKELKAFGRIP